MRLRAFYPLAFRRGRAVLTMDGVGEWATTSAAVGRGNKLEILQEIHFPHSLGLLYSAFTYYTGFKVNSGEYKVMGLAPYGQPKYAQLILDNLIDLKPDGSFRLNHVLLRLLHRPHHDQRAASPSCSAGRCEARRAADRRSTWMSRPRSRRCRRRRCCG